MSTTIMPANRQAGRKSFRGAIKHFGKKISKVAARPFRRAKTVDTTSSSDDEHVIPCRIVLVEAEQQRETQRTAYIPRSLKSRSATPVLTTLESIIEEDDEAQEKKKKIDGTGSEQQRSKERTACFPHQLEFNRPSPVLITLEPVVEEVDETQEQQHDEVKGDELVLWQNPLDAMKKVASDSLENAPPANFLFATNKDGESIIISRDVAALPWSDKLAMASIQALFANIAGDNTKANMASDTPDTPLATATTTIATRLRSWKEMVNTFAAHFQDILSTLMQQANAHFQSLMWMAARSVLMTQSSANTFGEWKIPFITMEPAEEVTRAILSSLAAFNITRAGFRLTSEQGSSTSFTHEAKRQPHNLLLPAPAEWSDSSPQDSGDSSNDDDRPETPDTEHTEATPAPFPPLLTADEVFNLLSSTSIFRYCQGDRNIISQSYPPNGFYVRPEHFDAGEEELRGRKFHIPNNYSEEVPKFLPGLIGNDVDGVLEKDPDVCSLGECVHFENPCWPARHFINLGTLMQEMGVNTDNGDEVHIAINVTGSCAMMAYPPYGELEIHAKSIIDVKVYEKNTVPTGVIGDHCEYVYGLGTHFVDMPVFIYCNEPIPEMVLDHRIGDVIHPLLESAAPPVLMSYLDHNHGAEYHRAPFAKHYRQKGLLGEVVRIKAIPQVCSGGDDDNEVDLEKEEVASHLGSQYSWASTIQFSDDGDDEESLTRSGEEGEAEDEEPQAEDEDTLMAETETQDTPSSEAAAVNNDMADTAASNRHKRDAAKWAAPGKELGGFETYNAPNTTFADVGAWHATPWAFRYLQANGETQHQWPVDITPVHPQYVFKYKEVESWERSKEMARDNYASNVQIMRQHLSATRQDTADAEGLVDPEDVVLYNCWTNSKLTSDWLYPQEDQYDREAEREQLQAKLRPGSEIDSGYLGYDCDECKCIPDRRVKCPYCSMKGHVLTDTPGIVDWVEAVEVNRVDGEWQGESGTIELGEDLPGCVLTPAQQHILAKKVDLFHLRLKDSLDREVTREQGGIVRWARNWLSTSPEQHPSSKEIELNDGIGLTEVVAHAMSSVQTLELRYSTIKKTLTLVADNIATFEVVSSTTTSEEMRAQIAKVYKEGWWQPALAALGVPCRLLCNLPVTRVTVDSSSYWWNDVPRGSMVAYHRVDPGFPQDWR